MLFYVITETVKSPAVRDENFLGFMRLHKPLSCQNRVKMTGQ